MIAACLYQPALMLTYWAARLRGQLSLAGRDKPGDDVKATVSLCATWYKSSSMTLAKAETN
jgi:hypothetical protein